MTQPEPAPEPPAGSPAEAEEEAVEEARVTAEATRIAVEKRITEELAAAAPKGSVAPAQGVGQRARESLARTLLNHNDFITIH